MITLFGGLSVVGPVVGSWIPGRRGRRLSDWRERCNKTSFRVRTIVKGYL